AFPLFSFVVHHVLPGRSPTLSAPKILAAYCDADHVIAVQLSQPVNVAELTLRSVHVHDETGRRYYPHTLDSATYKNPSKVVRLTFSQAMPFSTHHLTVSLDGFEGEVPLILRHVLQDRSRYYDADAVLGAQCS